MIINKKDRKRRKKRRFRVFNNQECNGNRYTTKNSLQQLQKQTDSSNEMNIGLSQFKRMKIQNDNVE